MNELEKAQAAYPSATKSQKQVLEAVFGKDAFVAKITDRIKTFEDACSILGITPDSVTTKVHSNKLSGDAKAFEAFAKLTVIARALNEGWQPDWSNSNEWKYYPWFKFKAGSGFSAANTGYDHTGTAVGSRLVFKTEALATYAGEQFKSIYNDFLTL